VLAPVVAGRPAKLQRKSVSSLIARLAIPEQMLIAWFFRGVRLYINHIETSKSPPMFPSFGIELSILGYRGRVPRNDENGRQLRALLDYLLDGQLRTQQIHRALGISSSSYSPR
jgi:hypothetical protein